jgi:hypothetical protein
MRKTACAKGEVKMATPKLQAVETEVDSATAAAKIGGDVSKIAPAGNPAAAASPVIPDETAKETPETPAAPEAPTPPASADEAPPAPDPFNIEALRLPPAFVQAAGVKKQLTTVPVRKPHSQEWIRVHSHPDYRGDFGTIYLKEEREFYLLTPGMAKALEGNPELKKVTIYTVMNRQGVTYLWPVPLVGQGAGRRVDLWYSSAHEAAVDAMTRLVRVSANTSLGAYERSYSDNDTRVEPDWTVLSFVELLRIEFKNIGCFVENFDHPVIKQLFHGA